jgi:uncharacterized protein
MLRTETLLKQLTTFAQTHPEINALYLFGSHARDEATSASDIDVALLLRPEDASRPDFELELSVALMEALGREEVDVLILNTAAPRWQFEAIAHGRLVFSRDEETRLAWALRVLDTYYDMQPFLAEYSHTFVDRLKETFTDEERRAYESARAAFARAPGRAA